MNNTKLKVYNKILPDVCEKLDTAEEFIKEKIEELCSKRKLSVEEVTYLFMKDYENF